MVHRLLVVLMLVITALFGPLKAVAQVPPHAPGTICITPYFWCWANSPGKPGYPCYCKDNKGYSIKGYLG